MERHFIHYDLAHRKEGRSFPHHTSGVIDYVGPKDKRLFAARCAWREKLEVGDTLLDACVRWSITGARNKVVAANTTSCLSNCL